MNKRGQLIVFSGPSGVGKGTVLHQYLESRQNVMYSVSATTRQPRPGEIDGVHYHFITRSTFEQLIENQGMLEYAVYNGNYYGTPKKAVDDARARGIDVVLEIEVQGALQIKKLCPDALLVFVMPPCWKELESRLTGRHTEDEETIQKRLTIAKKELTYAYNYDYIIVNDTVEQAVGRFAEIVDANQYSQTNMKEFIDEVSQNA